jgi:flagellar basal-body rod protein FlgC
LRNIRAKSAAICLASARRPSDIAGMTDAISTALSGLLAAQKRIAGVASNIANAGDISPVVPQPGRAQAYQPVTTVQTTTAIGGTVATYQPVTPASQLAFVPDSPEADSNGLVNVPNVDIAGQAFDLITAKEAYKANLKTVQTAEAMSDSLLKIVT